MASARTQDGGTSARLALSWLLTEQNTYLSYKLVITHFDIYLRERKANSYLHKTIHVYGIYIFYRDTHSSQVELE